LLSVSGSRHRQTNLRRELSTAYYALFHSLARSSADTLVGETGMKRAWNQVYRALEHGAAAKACERKEIGEFPAEIQVFARAFVKMQGLRHKADYSPLETYSKSEVEHEIDDARLVIEKFENTEIRHRRAFAAFVLLRLRRGQSPKDRAIQQLSLFR